MFFQRTKSEGHLESLCNALKKVGDLEDVFMDPQSGYLTVKRGGEVYKPKNESFVWWRLASNKGKEAIRPKIKNQ